MPKPVLIRVLLAVLVAALGLAIRLGIAATTYTDYDEDEYLIAAAEYRRLLDAGDLTGVMNPTLNTEHPPLAKLLYAVGIDSGELATFPVEGVRFNRIELPEDSLRNARMQSVAFGTVTVFVVALASPLAGLALAVLSMHAHYSSVAYLEALPALLSAVGVLLYTVRRPWAFWLSAIFLGSALAGKYPFGLAVVAVGLHWLLVRRDFDLRARLTRMAGWGIVALLALLALNPYLWPEPMNRLVGQLTYFNEYAETLAEDRWLLRPFHQLLNPRSHMGHIIPPSRLDWFTLADRVLFVLAVPGLALLLWRRSVFGWWLAGGAVFLMVWGAQWPQHKMIIVTPLAFAAATSVGWALRRLFGARASLRLILGAESDQQFDQPPVTRALPQAK